MKNFGYIYKKIVNASKILFYLSKITFI